MTPKDKDTTPVTPEPATDDQLSAENLESVSGGIVGPGGCIPPIWPPKGTKPWETDPVLPGPTTVE
ncbi:MAG: hypothetical protein IT361_10345 [Gemmatimonadaceae bacterium]|nr:hypothetical protein [Gemmatimonadaceae bacterium]